MTFASRIPGHRLANVKSTPLVWRFEGAANHTNVGNQDTGIAGKALEKAGLSQLSSEDNACSPCRSGALTVGREPTKETALARVHDLQLAHSARLFGHKSIGLRTLVFHRQ